MAQWCVFGLIGAQRRNALGKAAAREARQRGEEVGAIWREEAAARSLARAGYSAWAPMVARIVRRRRGPLRLRETTQIREPWLKNYLFVDVASGGGWTGLIGHKALGPPIRFGADPAVIAPELVQALRDELALWDAAEAERDGEGLSLGDRIRIELGILAGLEGRVEEVRPGAVRIDSAICGGAPVWVQAADCVRLVVGRNLSGGVDGKAGFA